MISYLTQVVNLLALIFQKCITVTSLVGQLIVIFISSVTAVVITVILNLVLFFQVVYEDNVAIFTEDLPCLATDLFDNVSNQWHRLLDALIAMYNEVTFKYYVIFGAIEWFIEGVTTMCGELLLMWKKTLIFVGESLWIVLTFVPVHLPCVLKTIFKVINDCIVNSILDVYMSLLRFTNFLSDVPLESFIGILITILIVRLCIYYREAVLSYVGNIYWILLRKSLYLYHTLYNYFTNSEARMIAHIASGQQIATRDLDLNLPDVDDTVRAADALCVICQERQKCVLTLPCRHICLCTECCVRLYGYQRTCPVCRTFIYHSVTVYL